MLVVLEYLAASRGVKRRWQTNDVFPTCVGGTGKEQVKNGTHLDFAVGRWLASTSTGDRVIVHLIGDGRSGG